MKSKLKIKKGFTLVEVLLYISLVSMVMLVIAAFFGTLIETQNKSRATQEVDQNATQINQYLSLLLRNATSITSPDPAGTITNSITFDSNLASSNPVVIDLSAGKIRITEGAGSPIELNGDNTTASGLEFKNLTASSGDTSIKFEYVLTYNNPDNRQSLEYSSTYYGSGTLRE